MWKAWEGRTVDGKFPLQAYLGGSDHSAVFLTARQTGFAGDANRAVIKLIACDKADPQKQLLSWRTIRDLRHPNLIQVFDAGSCELDGIPLHYVVEEYAEENLGQIIPERALTTEEAQGALAAVLDALQFLHDEGFVHGRIQPSNILAVGDQVKLSSDGLRLSDEKGSAKAPSAYDPPEAASGAISRTADIWQLGMTLVEALTQRLPVQDRMSSGGLVAPATMAEPFHEIAVHCLQVDEGKRWSISEIVARLRSDRSKPAPMMVKKEAAVSPGVSGQRRPSRAWSYLLGLAVVAAVAFLLIPRSKPSVPAAAVQSRLNGGSNTSVRPEERPSAVATGGVKGEGSAAGSGADEKESSGADENGVVHQELPEVAPGARRTIHGTIQVRVKVSVDAAGNVTKAKVESGRVSKYFKRIALDAARDWKFSPVTAGNESGDREWRLQFGFSRAKTQVAAIRVTR